MDVKAKDFIKEYRRSDADGRLDLMLNNYGVFPQLVRMLERRIKYKIKTERERLVSKARGELGVRIQKSDISKPTEEEAVANVTMDEAFETGVIDPSILKGIESSDEYAEDIRIISIMKMDFELLSDSIDALGAEDSEWIKEYFNKEKLLKEIALDQDKSYDAMKKRLVRLRMDLRDAVIDCLEMNCTGGE